MLYVPIFTPPLDTAVGGERLDVQLIDVTLKTASIRSIYPHSKSFSTLRFPVA